MTKVRMPFRVGQIDYTNVWPVYYEFPGSELEQEISLYTAVPSKLNAALQQGNIDLSAISSFAYGANYEQYLLLPHLSVSSVGRVNSILLFHKKPLEQIAFGKIALTTSSATSINLLKIMLEKFYEGTPQYVSAEPTLETMMDEADAALLIGDDAIRANWRNRQYNVTDLGELWHRWTGYGMSYAVWAVRKEAAEREPQLLSRIYEAFLNSKQRGVQCPDRLLQAACQKVGGTASFWRDYFTQLCYDFDLQQQKGLELYFRFAWELGLIDKHVPLQLWNDKTVIQVNE